MIDKAFGLQEAVRNAVYSDGVRLSALNILHGHQMMNEEEMQKALMELVSELASVSSFFTVQVLLSEDEQNELADTIDMLQGMGNN
jgi:hypothetical protein